MVDEQPLRRPEHAGTSPAAPSVVSAAHPADEVRADSLLQIPPVAIIGMAGLFPQAASLQEYWDNIVTKRDCITEVPPGHWDVDAYYDPDPSAPDKTYARRGGFLPDVPFDPLEFGLPPAVLEVTDTSQLLALIVAKQALADAGYGAGAPFDRDRTGVILGVSGAQKLVAPLVSRLQYPVWERALRHSGISEDRTRRICETIQHAYVGWGENAFPGLLGNVVAGRVANRLDLGGTNCTVDAACASSLGALQMALSELATGNSEMIITGGVDTDTSIFMYLCFSKTPALSPGGVSRPFDAASDGIVLGEGIGMLVLKRLADAERAGDRIYAVIRGLGASSDGRFKSIYAPRSEGQESAVRRAYRQAGFPLGSVGLIEAHGTGTVVGDAVEVTTLTRLLAEQPGQTPVALGSVKSQIGHTKAAAGAAGLIKTALALHHKVLPATINVQTPHPSLAAADSPLYLNTETRPWPVAAGSPRRAGVSAFGFGGSNFHVALEEYTPDHTAPYRLHTVAQPVMVSAASPAALTARCRDLAARLQSPGARQCFEALLAGVDAPFPAGCPRLGFVAATPGEAADSLVLAAATLDERAGMDAWEHPRGIFFRASGLALSGRVVALFPGQGSQYLNMGASCLLNFPELRGAYAALDDLRAAGEPPLSSIVFPPPTFDAAVREAQAAALQRTEYAQPAIGAFSAGLYRLLLRAGFQPDFVGGHSFGELTALWAAGVLDDGDYYRLARARGRAMAPPADPDFDAGVMLAVQADSATLTDALGALPGVVIANVNAPQQLVLAGPSPAIARARQTLQGRGISATRLPVSAAFHTSLVEHARKPFAAALESARFHAPGIPVYANATADPYPGNPEAMRTLLAGQILQPVQFQQQVEALYAAGGFLFVECGPRSVLTSLVRRILGDRPYLAVALNPTPAKDSDRQFREALLQLRVAGLSLRLRDPYAQPSPVPESKPEKRGAAVVQLDGANYVSEQTRHAFDQALADLQSISEAPAALLSPLAPSHGAPVQSREVPLQPEPVASAYAGEVRQIVAPPVVMRADEVTYAVAPPIEDTRSHALPHTEVIGAALQPTAAVPVAAPGTVPAPQANPWEALANLTRILQGMGQHHHDTLIAHQYYFATQTAYTQAFFGLMHQQQSLLFSGAAATLPPQVVESISTSMALFHQQQTETARVHEQYLGYQAEFARGLLAHLQPGEHAVPPRPVPILPALPVTSSVPAAPMIDPLPPPPMIAALPPLPAPAPWAAEARSGSQGVAQVVQPVPAVPPITPATWPAAPSPAVPLTADPPTVPMAAVPAVPAAPGSSEVVAQVLLEVVSEKTGYPVQTLELPMDVEADLGIDSIKRVEILGAMRDRFPEAPELRPADLAELRTLQEIVSFLAASPTAAGSAPAAGRPELFAGIEAVHTTPASVLAQAPVRVQLVPPPDWQETMLPPGYWCLLTADGTALTATLAAALADQGWPVVVLQLPERLVPAHVSLPATVPVVRLEDVGEADLQAGCAAIATRFGPVGAWIHLQPPGDDTQAWYSERDEQLVQTVFLLAGQLGPSLVAAAVQGYGAFCSVLRLDGALGTSGCGAISGSLFGLAKTLHLEWPDVRCRAVDLDPNLEVTTAVHLLLAELHDPSRRLAEVGVGAGGRVTLAVDPLTSRTGAGR